MNEKAVWNLLVKNVITYEEKHRFNNRTFAAHECRGKIKAYEEILESQFGILRRKIVDVEIEIQNLKREERQADLAVARAEAALNNAKAAYQKAKSKMDNTIIIVA